MKLGNTKTCTPATTSHKAMEQFAILEPPCCGCDGWVFAHIVQTVVVADDMLAIGTGA